MVRTPPLTTKPPPVRIVVPPGGSVDIRSESLKKFREKYGGKVSIHPSALEYHGGVRVTPVPGGTGTPPPFGLPRSLGGGEVDVQKTLLRNVQLRKPTAIESFRTLKAASRIQQALEKRKETREQKRTADRLAKFEPGGKPEIPGRFQKEFIRTLAESEKKLREEELGVSFEQLERREKRQLKQENREERVRELFRSIPGLGKRTPKRKFIVDFLSAPTNIISAGFGAFAGKTVDDTKLVYQMYKKNPRLARQLFKEGAKELPSALKSAVTSPEFLASIPWFILMHFGSKRARGKAAERTANVRAELQRILEKTPSIKPEPPISIIVSSKTALKVVKKVSDSISKIKRDYKLWKINKSVQLEVPFWKVRANVVKLQNRLKALQTDLKGKVGERLGVYKSKVSSIVKGIRKQIKDDVNFYSGRRKAIFEKVVGRKLRGIKGDLTNKFEWNKEFLSKFTKSQQARMKVSLKNIKKQIRDDVAFYGSKRRAQFDKLIGRRIRGLKGDLSNKAFWTGEAVAKLVKKPVAKLTALEKAVKTQVKTDVAFYGSKRRAIFEKVVGRKLRGIKGDLTNKFEWKAESLKKFTKAHQVKMKQALKDIKKQIRDNVAFYGSKRRAQFDKLIRRRIRGLKGDLSNKAFFAKEATTKKMSAIKAKVKIIKETIKPIPKIIKRQVKADITKLKIAGFKKLPKGIRGAIRRAKAPKELVPISKIGRFTFFEQKFLKAAKPKNIDFWQQRASQLKKVGFQKKIREILETGDRDISFKQLPKSVQRIFKRAAVEQSPRGIIETLRFIQKEYGKDFIRTKIPTIVKSKVALLKKADKVSKAAKLSQFRQVETIDSQGRVQITLQKTKVSLKPKVKTKVEIVSKMKQVSKVVPRLKFKSLASLLAVVGTGQSSKLSQLVGQVPGTKLTQIPGQIQQFRQVIVPVVKQISKTVQSELQEQVGKQAQRAEVIQAQVQKLRQVSRSVTKQIFGFPKPPPPPIILFPKPPIIKIKKFKIIKGKPKPVLTRYTFTVVRPRKAPRHLKFFTGAELR